MLLRRASAGRNPGLFRTGTHFKRSPGGALAASAGLHLAMLAAVLFLSTLTVATRSIRADQLPRLVFLATPGPGGGGGGGGLRQPIPPARAELAGGGGPEKRCSSPGRDSPARSAGATDASAGAAATGRRTRSNRTPPAAPPEPMPQVVAPVATAPADARDRAGTVAEPTRDIAEPGPGSGRRCRNGKRAPAWGRARVPASARARAAGLAAGPTGRGAASLPRQSSVRSSRTTPTKHAAVASPETSSSKSSSEAMGALATSKCSRDSGPGSTSEPSKPCDSGGSRPRAGLGLRSTSSSKSRSSSSSGRPGG